MHYAPHFEFLSTAISLLISSHRNIIHFYPHIFPSANPNIPFISHTQRLPLFLTSPNPHQSPILNTSTLFLSFILLSSLYIHNTHVKFHAFIVPVAFSIAWGVLIIKGVAVPTDFVLFTIFPWLVFVGLMGSRVCVQVLCVFGRKSRREDAAIGRDEESPFIQEEVPAMCR